MGLENIFFGIRDEVLVEEVPLDDCTVPGAHWCRSVDVELKALYYRREYAKRILHNTQHCESHKGRVCVQSRSNGKP